MNRIDSLFARRGSDLLSVYLTAGFPTLNSMPSIISALCSRGVDMIEVGAPFSDPMADGPVIQHSSSVALAGGMNLRLLLDQVEASRKAAGDTPLILMGYLNPFIQYGIGRLFERCKSAGIDGLIIPDLPFDEYLRDYKPLCDRYGLPIIMLITPETSPERIRLIDSNCSGFIYMVSSASTTGTRDSFGPGQLDYFERINAMGLSHRRLIGFGISDRATFRAACDNAAGGIIGSLFIKCLEAHQGDIAAAVDDLVDRVGHRPAAPQAAPQC